LGHKVHPVGFRIGVIYDWQSKWYADKHYTGLLHEDLEIRRLIMSGLWDAGISKIEIDRNANQAVVTVHTAKPGIVIGRGGQKVDELRARLEQATGRRVRVNISEIRQPELDAYLVARSVAEQLQRRVAFRRAIKQAVSRTMQRGAKGVKIIVGGRLGGTEMSRRETEMEGRVPLHTLRADIDYGLAEAHTTFGRIGVKVWIYKGEILPEPKVVREVEEPAVAVPAAEAPEQAPSVAEEAAVAVPAAEAPEQAPSVAEEAAVTVPAAEAPEEAPSVAEEPAAAKAEEPAAAKAEEPAAAKAEEPAAAKAEEPAAAKAEEPAAAEAEEPAAAKAEEPAAAKAEEPAAAEAEEAETPAPEEPEEKAEE
jgi:small subunit ribosomal protein S3